MSGRGDQGSKQPVAECRSVGSRGPGFKTTCGRVSHCRVEGTRVQNNLW